jgi:hypothetical protein
MAVSIPVVVRTRILVDWQERALFRMQRALLSVHACYMFTHHAL